MWRKNPDRPLTPFTWSLLGMPILEEVALAIPEFGNREWYAEAATREISRLLQLGEFWRVRFLYGSADEDVSDCRYMEIAKRPERRRDLAATLEEMEREEELHDQLPDRIHATREHLNDSFLRGEWGSWPNAAQVFVLECTSDMRQEDVDSLLDCEYFEDYSE